MHRLRHYNPFYVRAVFRAIDSFTRDVKSKNLNPERNPIMTADPLAQVKAQQAAYDSLYTTAVTLANTVQAGVNSSDSVSPDVQSALDAFTADIASKPTPTGAPALTTNTAPAPSGASGTAAPGTAAAGTSAPASGS